MANDSQKPAPRTIFCPPRYQVDAGGRKFRETRKFGTRRATARHRVLKFGRSRLRSRARMFAFVSKEIGRRCEKTRNHCTWFRKFVYVECDDTCDEAIAGYQFFVNAPVNSNKSPRNDGRKSRSSCTRVKHLRSSVATTLIDTE